MRILIYPHEILKTKAEPVKEIDARLQEIVDRMFETMYKAKGIGLAANQVGIPIRLLVMDVREEEGRPNRLVLVNPVIQDAEGGAVGEEGCLSVPGYTAPVKRAERILVEALDREGSPIRFEAEGLLARCIQHEIDHLDGICFVDRLGPVKRSLFRRKWAKMRPKEE